MSTLIVKLTRDQHRQIKREAKAYAVTLSDLVRHRLGLYYLPGVAGSAVSDRPVVPTPFDGGPAPEGKP